jgi:hypothetical protein
MAGVVGGDVGLGTFSGQVLKYAPGLRITKIEALYHVNGLFQSFTAHVFVTQNNVSKTAVIKGVVTDGWLKGSRVSGNYVVLNTCPGEPLGAGPCFQGVLHISGSDNGSHRSDHGSEGSDH